MSPGPATCPSRNTSGRPIKTPPRPLKITTQTRFCKEDWYEIGRGGSHGVVAVRLGEPWELQTLYQRSAGEMARVLKLSGVVVLLTSERAVMEDALAAAEALYIERLIPVEVLGQKAFFFKLKKF